MPVLSRNGAVPAREIVTILHLQMEKNIVSYKRAALCWTEAAAGGNNMNNETKRGKYTVHDLVRISVLVAIMLLLEVTGLGMIKMPGLEITLLMVPVIVGAIVMGPASGWAGARPRCWAAYSASSASGSASAKAASVWC